MKLLFCTKCQDMVRLMEDESRRCKCGETRGKYTDKIRCIYTGPCMPVGIDNNSIVEQNHYLGMLGYFKNRGEIRAWFFDEAESMCDGSCAAPKNLVRLTLEQYEKETR